MQLFQSSGERRKTLTLLGHLDRAKINHRITHAKGTVDVKVVLLPTVNRQSISVSGPHLEPATRFLLLLGCCWFVDVGRPLRREDRAVICSYKRYWALPALSLSGPSPAGHVAVSDSFEIKFSSCLLLRLAGLR
jgi:hypothetical protein